MTRRALVVWILRLAITALLLAWVFSRAEIRDGLTAAEFHQPWWLLGAFVCGGATTILSAVRWQACLRACECVLPFGTVLRVSLAGNAAGLLSVGSLGEDAVRVALGSKQLPNRKAALITSIALDHVAPLPALGILGAVIFAGMDFSLATVRTASIVATVSFVVFFSAGLTLRLFNRGLHDRLLGYVTKRLFSRGAAVSILISVPLLMCYHGVFWCAARALPIPADPVGLFGAFVVADTVAALPVSIAGLGLREKSIELLLHNWYGIAPALAVKASLSGLAFLAIWAVAGVVCLPLRRLNKAAAKTDAAAPSPSELSARYPERFARYYAHSKFATDPLYGAVYDSLAGTSVPLLDIGCGMGLCSFYLRERGCNFPIRGLDYDAPKVALAQRVAAAHAPDLVFETSDARTGLPEHSGSVTILDILQYMDAEGQAALLREAAARVSAGGKLVIRTGMEAPGWRFKLTKLTDLFAACCFWMKARPVCYPRPETLNATLESCGLRGTILPMWGRTPFNNWLAVFERADGRMGE